MPLTIEIETSEPGPLLKALALEIEKHPEASRERAAQLVRAAKLGAYVGGHHVAVHYQRRNKLSPRRVAVIRGTGADWL